MAIDYKQLTPFEAQQLHDRSTAWHKRQAELERESPTRFMPLLTFEQAELLRQQHERRYPAHRQVIQPPQPHSTGSLPDTARSRHEARLRAFREADQQQCDVARQEIARRLGASEGLTESASMSRPAAFTRDNRGWDQAHP
jgi:hypothetical protein